LPSAIASAIARLDGHEATRMSARRDRGRDGRRDEGRASELLTELAAVYADAERAHAGWSCPASTEC
jgi:hypothetical protein